MVLSVHGYNGEIVIKGNTFANNMVFIPSAVLSGRAKPLNGALEFEEFIVDSTTLSFKSGEKYFMNHLDMESWSDPLLNEF